MENTGLLFCSEVAAEVWMEVVFGEKSRKGQTHTLLAFREKGKGRGVRKGVWPVVCCSLCVWRAPTPNVGKREIFHTGPIVLIQHQSSIHRQPSHSN
jgi:hypothetical protein